MWVLVAIQATKRHPFSIHVKLFVDALDADNRQARLVRGESDLCFARACDEEFIWRGLYEDRGDAFRGCVVADGCRADSRERDVVVAELYARGTLRFGSLSSPIIGATLFQPS